MAKCQKDVKCKVEFHKGVCYSPYFFVIYINDLPEVTDAEMFLFADDTTSGGYNGHVVITSQWKSLTQLFLGIFKKVGEYTKLKVKKSRIIKRRRSERKRRRHHPNAPKSDKKAPK